MWPDLFKLDNKIIVVTGGAGLIGSKVVKGLTEAGGKVIISEINEHYGKKLECECKSNKLDAIFKKVDITKEESVDSLIEFCMEKFKRIDAWVNMAYPYTKDWDKKENLTNYSIWRKNVDMHLGGYYITSIKVAEIMKKQHYGSIVNFSSIYGVNAPDFSIYEGTEMTTPIPYPAIKGGINMLTKYIATYYGKYNVRANLIAPGGIFDNQPQLFVEKYIKKVPLNRMGKVEDIVGPVIFLVSDAASYITGHILMVDGGWSTW